MDSKVIILLVFLAFSIIIGVMVGTGMIDLTSVFQRGLKDQAQGHLGAVQFQVVSPVSGVYYKASADDAGHKYLDLGSIVEVTGKNLAGKTLTVSVSTSGWYLSQNLDVTTDSDNNKVPDDVTNGATFEKTEQFTVPSDGKVDKGDLTLYLYRDEANYGPFNLPEYVELIFAVGEDAKAEVTIVVEP
jgi:hypothetical protein